MWITRDKDGSLWIHELKPEKCSRYWVSDGTKESLTFKNYWFPEVKWEDEEPRELILK